MLDPKTQPVDPVARLRAFDESTREWRSRPARAIRSALRGRVIDQLLSEAAAASADRSTVSENS